MYVKPTVEIPNSVGKVEFSAEIQITTQLKEVMRQLTHGQHQERRQKERPAPDEKWQWDHRSKEFVPNYLGHMLHYLEGMIMQVRDQQREAP